MSVGQSFSGRPDVGSAGAIPAMADCFRTHGGLPGLARLPAGWVGTAPQYLRLGAAVSLAWFGWQGKRSEDKPPRAIWALLCCQLLLAGLGAGALYLGAYRWLDLAEAGLLAPERVGRALGLALTLTGAGSAALGLTLARLEDRRWRALYILGLTILALCLLALSVLRSMSLDSSIPGWQRPYLIRAALTALAGFCAAGAGLC